MATKINLRSSMASAAFLSKAVVILFVFAAIVCGGLVFSVRSMFCFALLCVHSSFAIISLRKRELVALLLLCSECHCRYYRSFTLPRGAMGWSVLCDCGISWSYSLICLKEEIPF